MFLKNLRKNLFFGDVLNWHTPGCEKILRAPHEEEEEDQDKAAHDTETSSLIWLWISQLAWKQYGFVWKYGIFPMKIAI